MKHVAILGSTGSIGRQALDVIAAHDRQLTVYSLACHSNDRLLETQIAAFNPRQAVLTDRAAYERLKGRYQGDTEILYGEDGLAEMDEELKLNPAVIRSVLLKIEPESEKRAPRIKPTMAA